MSDPTSDPTDPDALPRLDPDEFVGRPPAGDVDPGAFASTDQSAPPGEAGPGAVRDKAAGPEDQVSVEETAAATEDAAGEASA